MEAKDYRETLAMLRELYPDKIVITPAEVASVISCDVRTVYNMIDKLTNPLPAKKFGKKYVVPITSFASWLCKN